MAAVGPQVELIVSDLDGTFLSPDGTVSPTNAEAVRQWCAAGGQFMVATGRPLRWLDPIRDIAGTTPWVIASNGAVVLDLDNDSEVLSRRIDPQLAASMIQDLRRTIPGTCFAVEFGREFGHEEDYPVIEDGLPGRLDPGPVEQFLDLGPFVKLLVRNDGLDADTLALRAAEVVGGQLTVTHSAATGVGLLELSALGVSKGSTLAELCVERGLSPHQVAAFGDMPNDHAMLDWVAHPHVMANSHPDTINRGRLIGSNAESSVGLRILELLALR